MKQTDNFFQEQMQRSLTQAFYWMAVATKESKDGNFSLSVKDILRAVSYWTEVQHLKDSYLRDEEIDFVKMTEDSLAEAKEEIANEDKGE